MTFKQIQDAVLLDHFDETNRPDCKNWINSRYTWICDLERWSFMDDSATVTVTSGSQTVTGLPADFVVVSAINDQYGQSLEKIMNPSTFYARYTGSLNIYTGQPEAFTVDGPRVLLGPTPNISSTAFRIFYERAAPLLVADGDIPIIPAGYHTALVYGGKAEGMKFTSLLYAEDLESGFQGAIQAMRAKYSQPIRDRQPQSPAYRP